MREPDEKSQNLNPEWKAWLSRQQPYTKDQEAGLQTWLMHCPGAHPMWSYWLLYLIHLRPIEGVKPAHKNFPEASHEIAFFALNPDSTPDPDDGTSWEPMSPVDLVHQVGGLTDDMAEGLMLAVVKSILTGRVSADQDFRSFWKRSLDATAQHYREGKHGVG